MCLLPPVDVLQWQGVKPIIMGVCQDGPRSEFADFLNQGRRRKAHNDELDSNIVYSLFILPLESD
uniref:Raptor_N domain-containing protein n=1 Tax=Heterorhabditis bacteriophora TaxID=37862 RepID=A0A1I7WMW0_HETBA